MAVQLPSLVLMIITITNFAGGELFLQMPLTINPVVQDVITERGLIVNLFSSLDPAFYSRLSPVDMVSKIGIGLSSVMKNTVSGAVVLGEAAKSDGLTAGQLLYNAANKWTINVSLTDIRSILTTDEEDLVPLTDNITLTKLQNLGVRALEKKYNISLLFENITEALHSSNATTFDSIEEDWIRVVNFITASSVERLAARHGVAVETLAQALDLTSSELYNVALNELDEILEKNLSFVATTTAPDTMTTGRETTMSSTTPTTSKQSPTPPETMKTTLPTTLSVGSTTPGHSFTTKPSVNLVSSAAGSPTEGKTEETAKTNLALFVGLAVGLLLLLVASSSVWCLRRKRRNAASSQNQNTKNGEVKMNNLWLDKIETGTASSPEEASRAEQFRFVRSVSASTLGVDSRFKGLRYSSPRPSSSTFTECSTAKVPISRNSFLYDHRREIFV